MRKVRPPALRPPRRPKAPILGMAGHGKKFSIHASGGEEEPEFQVAPMVDVLLVLLMFFTATTTTEVKSQIADLTLPDAQEAKDREKARASSSSISTKWVEWRRSAGADWTRALWPD